MKTVVKWFLHSFWLLLLAPALAAFFERNGWHDLLLGLPGKIHDLLIQTFGIVAFPWVAGISFGLAAGFALRGASAKLFDWLNGPSPTTRKLQGLGKDATRVVTSISFGLSGFRAEERINENGIPEGIQGQLEFIWTELNKLKVDIPDFEGLEPLSALELASGYLAFIRPFLKSGNLTDVRRKASDWLASQ